MKCPVNAAGLRIWLERRAASHSDYFQPIAVQQARDSFRRFLRQNYSANPKGRGNRAWKRAAQLETAWRKSGGFYVEDFIAF
jgi:hypothetical protein